MKIAVFYICTGHYDMFWSTFYESCERYFYPSIKKEYFVFTDSKNILCLKNERIHPYFQIKSGWPYDTLMRYNWFCTVQDQMGYFDYCYFANANSKFIKDCTEEVIPFPSEEKPYVFCIHQGFFEDFEGKTFHPERNSLSTAYIPEGEYCRAYSGGFWGGRSDAFKSMCCELRDRIATDLGNGIIAIWHDQSHLTKYANEVPHIIVDKYLISSEQLKVDDKCIMYFQDKEKFGGQEKLRGMPFAFRIKKFISRVKRKLQSITRK